MRSLSKVIAALPTTVRKTALPLLVLLTAFIAPAHADVQSTGIVDPIRNPFDPANYPGLPVSGNFINPAEEPNPTSPSATNQTNFEGLLDINVGQTSMDHSAPHSPGTQAGFGEVLISSNTQLRYQDLIIGASATTGSTTTPNGTGVFRIDGFGALFNNNPTILPFGLNFASFGSKRNADAGYDVFVGKTGNGTLEISAGGRAEIQDAVMVGDSSGAVGGIVVDGFDSFLGSGGFDGTGGGGGSSGGSTPYHQMIIGRQGTGTMTVSAGATVNSESQPLTSSGGGQTGPIGAVLGSSPYSTTLGDLPDPGGNGTATITGTASKWIVGGSLQVGGFDIGLANMTVGDIEGDDTQYNSQVGRGTLYVNDGGIVNVRNAIGVNPAGGGNTTELLLAIGQFGIVQLSGGTIQVGGVTGEDNRATPDSVQVINDGIIRGSGRINTGVFRNRYLGQIRVDAAQSLVIDSASDFSTAGGATPSEPLVNYGRIQVLGNSQAQAKLEFIRATSDPLSQSPIRPLLNLPLTNPPAPQGAFVGGQISAQYADLRFGSGLENRSMLAFTAGTNNITGRVFSVDDGVIDPDGDGDAGDTAQVLVSGPGTTAVFHDDLAFGTGADLNLVNGGKVVVLNQHSFIMAGGNLNIELSNTHPSLITVGGDVGIGPGATNNDLSLTLASDVLSTLKHGDAFEIISFTGDIGGVDVTNPANPIIDFTTAPLFTDIDVSPDVFALHNLVPQVQFAAQGVYVTFLDPSMVGPGSGAVAPDFNGDGVIDLADFAIWKSHVGTLSGASVLDGDADGDGDVDGLDFLKWQRNVGKPMPWNGAGAGSGSASNAAAVPEPASLALLVCGGFAAVVFQRRRVAR